MKEVEAFDSATKSDMLLGGGDTNTLTMLVKARISIFDEVISYDLI